MTAADSAERVGYGGVDGRQIRIESISGRKDSWAETPGRVTLKTLKRVAGRNVGGRLLRVLWVPPSDGSTPLNRGHATTG